MEAGTGWIFRLNPPLGIERMALPLMETSRSQSLIKLLHAPFFISTYPLDALTIWSGASAFASTLEMIS